MTTPHRETITDTMYAVAEVVFNVFDHGYYLGGGTALALRIGHRTSVDLDYFIAHAIDTNALKEQIATSFVGVETRILYETENTLWCLIDKVKVSFISRFDPLVESVETVDRFRLASIKDITVMKLSAICGREEYKDYFDLACIAGVTSSRDWISWWQAAYPNADYTSFVVALAAAEAVEPVALAVCESFKGTDVARTLAHATREITDYLKLAP